jgi:hypothetical protein
LRPPVETKAPLPVSVRCPQCGRQFYRQSELNDPQVKEIDCRSTKCKERPPFRYRVAGGRVQIV